MANKFYAYFPDAALNPESGSATKAQALQVDDQIMALYHDVVKEYSAGGIIAATAPTAYADKAALDAALGVTTEVTSIAPRGLSLQVPGFGSAFMPVLNLSGEVINSGHVNGNQWGATLDNYSLANSAPFPVTPISESHLSIVITGFRGESRNAN